MNETIYIKIPCSEELPNESAYFFIKLNSRKDFAWFNINNKEFEDWREECSFEHEDILYWLKPVPMIKAMNDFAEWIMLQPYDYWPKSKTWFDCDNMELTTSEIQEEFLKNYKG